MSCDDCHSEPKFDLLINGLPHALRPVEGDVVPEPCECCDPNRLDVEISFEDPPPAEAVRADLSCSYSPLRFQPADELDWDRVGGLPLEQRPS